VPCLNISELSGRATTRALDNGEGIEADPNCLTKIRLRKEYFSPAKKMGSPPPLSLPASE
jgi:hypothetical protein